MSVAIVPYLQFVQGISISSGGYYLLVLSFSVAAGSFFAGVISATLRHHISLLSQMSTGSATLLLGTLLLFPPSASLQHNPYLPFIAVLITGFGDPLVTVATVPAMEGMQPGGKLSDKQRTMVSSVWLIGWVGSISGGTVLAGLVIDYLTFEIGSYILCGGCLLSLILNIVIKCLNRR